MAGGVGETDYLSGMETYTVASAIWKRNLDDRMTTPRTTAAAVSVAGGIYVLGGYNIAGWHNTVELFEPTIGWSEVRPMASPRALLAAVVI